MMEPVTSRWRSSDGVSLDLEAVDGVHGGKLLYPSSVSSNGRIAT